MCRDACRCVSVYLSLCVETPVVVCVYLSLCVETPVVVCSQSDYLSLAKLSL